MPATRTAVERLDLEPVRVGYGTTRAQSVALVVLRTAVGWHFLYEGFYKLMLPGWTRLGQPAAAWSAAGYLAVSSGPMAPLFRGLAHSSAMGFVDVAIPIGLTLVGLSLMLGLRSQWGCAGAMVFLALFYLSAIPTTGVPQSGAEGTYMVVSKNLVELVAVCVLFAFRTGRIAGLDLLWRGSDSWRTDR
jgi:thiosulfate dehydrogenase [quinone] large subunit